MFKVIKSNKRVRVLTNYHSSTDETELERLVAEKDNPDDYEEASNGRRKINTSTVLRDYSTTMNFTDCGAATGGRLTKFHRHSVRQSQPFLDFFTFEIAPGSAYPLFREKNLSYSKGVRAWAEQVIEETINKIIRSDERC